MYTYTHMLACAYTHHFIFSEKQRQMLGNVAFAYLVYRVGDNENGSKDKKA